ncbi:MAG: hypothetical protein HC898_06070, partial [Phycisphaerales bacterium]|nr:hypothetical protein [Phycisphaerales bacterium]
HTVSPQWLRQQSIDQAIEDSQSMVVLNHPNWWQNFDHWPTNLLMQMRRYHGVEIFNGVMMGEVGSAYALEKWDMLLGSGQRVWAFANDDTHHATGVGRGWNMVWAREPSAQGVREALVSGRFYASTGVKITTISATDKCIRVETDNARRIIARRDLGQRITHVDGPVMELESGQWGDANYVRFEAWGEPEQFAWTQPFWLRG